MTWEETNATQGRNSLEISLVSLVGCSDDLPRQNIRNWGPAAPEDTSMETASCAPWRPREASAARFVLKLRRWRLCHRVDSSPAQLTTFALVSLSRLAWSELQCKVPAREKERHRTKHCLTMAARLLRKTGEAIKHSPGALRRALTGGNKGSYQMALVQAQDPFKLGLSFRITYAGCEDMDISGDDGAKLTSSDTDPVVARRVRDAASKPRQRVMIVVNDTAITVIDPEGRRATVKIPLYRIAFAGSHPVHLNAFTFVERLRDTQRLVCHVMLCQSEHMSRTIVRAVSKAFQNAFLNWTAQERRRGGRGGAQSRTESFESGGAESGEPAPLDVEDDGAGDTEDAPGGGDGESEPAPQSRELSEEAKERRAMRQSFYRRSVMVAKPEMLETGTLEVAPDEFNLEEAAEYADPLGMTDEKESWARRKSTQTIHTQAPVHSWHKGRTIQVFYKRKAAHTFTAWLWFKASAIFTPYFLFLDPDVHVVDFVQSDWRLLGAAWTIMTELQMNGGGLASSCSGVPTRSC